ncbi:MAG: SBBP repeat-containing protein, partial [Nitrospiraceae bacterium]
MDRNNNVWFGIAGFIILATGFQPETFASPSPTGADPSTKARLVETYGKLPLSFEANQGQTDEQVKFLSRGPGYSVFLTPTEAVLALHKTTASRDKPSEKPVIPGKAAGRDPESIRTAQAKRDWMPASAGKTQPTRPASRDRDDQETRPRSLLRMQLVGAHPKPRVSGVDPLPGKVNYFRGKDPNRWRSNIPTYAKVKYENVYPGIDLVYYGNQRQLEHDFVVAPGADPRTIRLAFAGAERVGIDGQRDLLLRTAGGDVRLQKPVVYQNVNGKHHKIAGRYVLDSGKRKDKQQVGFQVAAYDKTKPLVIDPVLVYSTYLGSGGNDELGYDIAVDGAGNAYVTGETNSLDFPTQAALDASLAGGTDAFVAKLAPDGQALLYATYLGGGILDQGYGIAVDGAGNAYVTGFTSSSDFPVQDPLDASLGGGTDAFVAKLAPNGQALLYSTYLGGDNAD